MEATLGEHPENGIRCLTQRGPNASCIFFFCFALGVCRAAELFLVDRLPQLVNDSVACQTKAISVSVFFSVPSELAML